MSTRTPFSLDAAVRITWLLAAFMLLGIGVGLVWWPSAQRIEAIRLHARLMYEAANRNDAIVARSAQIAAARDRVRAEVRRLAGPSSLGGLTASAVHLLHARARGARVTIGSIAPDGDAPTGAPSDEVGLERLNLRVSARGRFAQLLRFMDALPRANVLLSISRVELASVAASNDPGTIDATIHVAIFRLTQSAAREVR